MIGLHLRSAFSPLRVALGVGLLLAVQACGDDTGDAGTTTTGGGQGAAGNTGNGAGAGTGNDGGDGNSANGGNGNAAAGGNGNAGGGGSGGVAGSGGPAGGDGGTAGAGPTGGAGGDGGIGIGGTGGSGGNGGDGGSGGDVCGAGGDGGNGAGGGGPDVVIPTAGVTVSTLAGGDTAGFTDGTGAEAEFNNPVNIILDDVGSLYVADFENSAIRYTTAAGDVGTPLSFQTGFARPFGMAYTQSGQLFVQTDLNPQGGSSSSSGTIWEVDYLAGVASPVLANIGRPRGLAAVGASVVMSDVNHHALRILNPAGPTITDLAGLWPCPGFADGNGVAARFRSPYGIAVTPGGDIVVADQGNNAIRLVTMAGVVSTLAGDGTAGMVDGDIDDARFDHPRDVAVDASGKVYVSDTGNHRIRRIDPVAGTVTTIAGDGVAGFADGSGTSARFFGQEGIDVTPDGSTIYVADGTIGTVQPYHRIRVVDVP